MNEPQPFIQAFPEVAIARVLRHPQLRSETESTEEWNGLVPPRLMAAPAEPHVQIKAPGYIRKLADDPYVHRYRVSLNFLPERLA